ncbi:cytochrome c biogenesis CcdA family protein [Bailinhaonella thermotolerans]|uniref:Cytochrome c biogenesis protein CcdA n=1 Tax=Bailinhaonella thermotolerans TaxID=1070861 RepID=A0A3A4BC83_9ACTN|nr:cytochrome c biogenesis CcdA family protein [Bailinhaonella thermotolerans]RJL31798.1 cytochrome c biogenesis protein CcdA [Bailinhaonella thermotolerans]
MTGYAAAFLGGLFSLLSPCGALLLPAFFAYAFPGGGALLGRTLLFYLGLCAVVVPLGLGSALAARLFYGHQDLLITVAGGALIALGLVQVAGYGGAAGPLNRLRARVRGDSAGAVLLLGAVSGLSGFCAGPVLGAVLTIAAASGNALRGGALLAVYAAGMAAPLLVMALLWRRFDLGRRAWLRGRGLRLGPLRVHSTSLLSGLTFAALGAAFLVTDGGRGLLPAIPESWEHGLQDAATAVQRHLPDPLLLGLAALTLAAVTAWRLLRLRPAGRPARRADGVSGDPAADGTAERGPASARAVGDGAAEDGARG